MLTESILTTNPIRTITSASEANKQGAEKIAEKMGLTTVREVQQGKLDQIKNIRQEIKKAHERVMSEHRLKNFDQYIEFMNQNKIKVIPSINKSNQLQGFWFEFKGYNLKGSEVHRSMTGRKLAIGIAEHAEKGFLQNQGKVIKLMRKATELSAKITIKLATKLIKKTIQKSMGFEIGY